MRSWILRVTLLVAILGLLAVEAYPSVFFENRLRHENLILYSESILGPREIEALTEASDLLKASTIYDQKREYEIHIANKPWQYLILGPDFGSGSFARINLFNKIIIRRCDFSSSKCYSDSMANNERTLAALIAHEITHVNIRHRFGYVAEITLPAWRKEGVADYVAQSSSFQGAAIDLLSSSELAGDKSFEYYQYRMVAAYVLEKKGLSIDEYIGGDSVYDQLLAQAILAQNESRIEQVLN